MPTNPKNSAVSRPMNVGSSYHDDPRLANSGKHEQDKSHPPLRPFKSGYENLMKNNWPQIPEGSPKQPKLKKPPEQAPAHSGLDAAKPPQPAKPYTAPQKSQQPQPTTPQQKSAQPQQQQKSQQSTLNTPSTSPQKSQPATKQSEQPAEGKSVAVMTEKITLGHFLYAHRLVAMAQVLANVGLTNKVQMDLALHSGAVTDEQVMEFLMQHGKSFRTLYQNDDGVKKAVDSVKNTDTVTDPQYTKVLEYIAKKLGVD